MKFCWAQYLLCWVIAILGAGSLLTACGQKGSLIQPTVSAGIVDSVEYKERAVKKP
ncbi:MAG: lipoprotein [Gammaproteobacteria bacterium]|nr:lipoprotein [Gammaproteobacteria bacterium]MCF6260950.1 lipoprotein [Gammaproteobacteria bacterium]